MVILPSRLHLALFKPGQHEQKETTPPPPFVSVIYWNVRGRSRCTCVPARYVREPLRRAPSPLCARRGHDDGRLDDDGGRPRGDERLPDDDAHWPDALGTLPWRIILPTSP